MDALTEDIVWTQIVYILVDQRSFADYYEVFITLLNNKDKSSIEQLTMYYNWIRR